MIAGYYRSRILAARQPQGATSCHTVKPATFRTEGIDHHHSTNLAPKYIIYDLLLDLYHAIGNPQGEAESYRLHDTFSQMLLKDHFQSTQLSEHRLIQVGDLFLMTELHVLNYHCALPLISVGILQAAVILCYSSHRLKPCAV